MKKGLNITDASSETPILDARWPEIDRLHKLKLVIARAGGGVSQGRKKQDCRVLGS